MSTDIDSSSTDEAPLVSNRFLYRLTAVIAVMAAVTVLISVGGRWYGQRMALGGHTDSTEVFSVQIGRDTVLLPANIIRNRDQRYSGAADRLDIYLTWPEMKGYSEELKASFNAASGPGSLLFLQLSQSTMTQDMSGRLDPIYSHMFEGAPQSVGHGLTMHRLRADSGYGNEVIYTGERENMPDYVVRCLLPRDGETPTGGDCQRDIRVGEDLSVLYRFSTTILKDWHHIDAAISAFVESRLADGIPRTNGKLL